MKKFVLLPALMIAVSSFAQQSFIEKAPDAIESPLSTITRDTFNLQFQFPTAAFVGEYGIESDGNNIYVSQWRDDSLARYDLYGNVEEIFKIQGVAYVRDLAYDGTYFYGSPNDFFIYVMDFTNKVLINTIPTDMSVRGIAYDSDDDALWISEYWSPNFYKLDKLTGATLDSLMPSGITLTAISGLAYDNQSPGGPWLWGFSQDSTGAIIIKYDIPNQAQTGNMIDVSGLAVGAAYAGGLFIEPLQGYAGVSIGGMIQNDQIFGLELGYANALVGIAEEKVEKMSVYPNPVGEVLNFDIKKAGTYIVSIYNRLGQLVYSEDKNFDRNSAGRLSTTSLSSGAYIIRIDDKQGYKAQASFVK